MRALVTGGAGFIGSHLSELLLDEGWEVFALDDLSTGAEANIVQLREREGFHLVVDSVLSPSVVSELVHRCDAVFHLAAAVGVRLIVEQPGRTLLTNVQGAENVLEYCARFEKPVLVASSSEVYGNHPEDVSLEENALRIYGPTTAKRWAYADTKALDEFLALALKHERGLRCVIVRLFNTVGPRQSSQYGNVIPRFVQRALAGEPLEVHGDGSQTRCFCHVSDVVRALRGLLEHADGEIYNVGSTDRITIAELAEQVRRGDGLELGARLRSLRGGLRGRGRRGDVPPGARDRQDPPRDRLGAHARARPDPLGRHRQCPARPDGLAEEQSAQPVRQTGDAVGGRAKHFRPTADRVGDLLRNRPCGTSARFVSMLDCGAGPFGRAEPVCEGDALQQIDDFGEQERSLALRPCIDNSLGDVNPLEPDDEVGGAEILARERARPV